MNATHTRGEESRSAALLTGGGGSVLIISTAPPPDPAQDHQDGHHTGPPVPDELLSQPQPVNGNIGISTVTSIQNNAKRPTALSPQQQQPVSRYPPREVPPRFRHQDQKSLLKRGQQIPGIAASLGSATKVLNQESESSTVLCKERTVTETPPGKHCMHCFFSQH
ncbi:hypothetical protein AB205_0153900 [Aquarana catesbeiana]|uniref:Uncharacterized protein n=1 Tax=Aquarana catesbeiana TaxID=8400 RepID=A0A2G9RK69_AQUCT|nr:hypothetical protein AB205_0153900 [Aquarana catesbeiana]